MGGETKTSDVPSGRADTGVPFDHVILTRFNLPSPGAEGLVRSNPTWLAGRAKLFERYCVPSVRNQAGSGAHWLVFLDPRSPVWLKDLMEVYKDEQILSPIYAEALSSADLIQAIRASVGRVSTTLVTTNLDNDDALSNNFLQRVASSIRANETYALYFEYGVIRGDKHAYLRKDRLNAFCTVVCPWDAPVTCWADWHNRLPKVMPATVLGGARAWMQVVHGDNVSNRIRGRIARPDQIRGSFPSTCIDSLAIPSSAHIVADFLVLYPARSARDSLRSALRIIVLGIGGKHAIDRLRLAAKKFSARSRHATRSDSDHVPRTL